MELLLDHPRIHVDLDDLYSEKFYASAEKVKFFLSKLLEPYFKKHLI